MNMLAAKARRCILNVAPAGCGKSAATDIVHMLMKGLSIKYTSLTLAGLIRVRDELNDYQGHVIIDDLGAEKSIWSRTSTVSVLATIVHTHNVRKVTQTAELQISNFQGSASLNIQPIMMNSLVQDEDWVAVMRDKLLRYYHLIRPIKPQRFIPAVKYEWGPSVDNVEEPRYRGRLWYQLIAIGLTQWSYARCLEHLPMLLRASAALDGRRYVDRTDYNLLIKLLKPMQLERYILASTDFEYGRYFMNNVYCILVEIASHGEPTIETICEDYKISPSTVSRVLATIPEWCWEKNNSPKKICPTDATKKILNMAGVNQRW
jgi:hypothetical protein